MSKGMHFKWLLNTVLIHKVNVDSETSLVVLNWQIHFCLFRDFVLPCCNTAYLTLMVYLMVCVLRNMKLCSRARKWKLHPRDWNMRANAQLSGKWIISLPVSACMVACLGGLQWRKGFLNCGNPSSWHLWPTGPPACAYSCGYSPPRQDEVHHWVSASNSRP